MENSLSKLRKHSTFSYKNLYGIEYEKKISQFYNVRAMHFKLGKLGY